MKNYEAPEALIVVFDEADLLEFSKNSTGDPETENWENGKGNW